MNGHGPDRASYDRAIAVDLAPVKVEGAMAFMFETRHVVRATAWAEDSASRLRDYDAAWAGFAKARLPKP